jgi:hypothetical protein
MLDDTGAADDGVAEPTTTAPIIAAIANVIVGLFIYCPLVFMSPAGLTSLDDGPVTIHNDDHGLDPIRNGDPARRGGREPG